MKIQGAVWEGILANRIPDRGLYPEHKKELSNLSKKISYPLLEETGKSSE